MWALSTKRREAMRVLSTRTKGPLGNTLIGGHILHVQFFTRDPRQLLGEYNMPELPGSGDLIEIDGTAYAQSVEPRRWRIVISPIGDLFWVVEIEVIEDRDR